MDIAALVARPRLPKIDSQFCAALRNFRLGQVDKRSENVYASVSPQPDRVTHGLHESLSAIGINSVVSRVSRYHQPVCLDGLRISPCDREHNPVPEWNDGLLHRGLFVMAIGNGSTGLKEIRLKEFVNETQMDGAVWNAELLAVPFRERDLLFVVLRTVVEADGANDLMGIIRIVKCRNGIHAATDKNNDFLFHDWAE